MLQIITIENRSQIKEIFADWKPLEQAWLVPDLRTKFELQQKILETQDHYLDESVLRASDLWRLLLRRVEPRIRQVSDHFARSLLRSLMDEHAEVLGVNSSAEGTLFSYIDQMAAIVFHPEGSERLNEWLQDHPEASNRWRDWYLRARFCALKLVNEHKIITSDWVTAYLQSFNDLERVWTIPLIVDLSGEITRVEAELIRALSRTVDVTILEPAPRWKSEFQYLLKPYEDLRVQSQTIKKSTSLEGTSILQKKESDSGKIFSDLNVPSRNPVPKTIEVLRFSGMLAEIRNTVGQVREWLEAGIKADQISIIAPDIEIYWPVLQILLDEEGVPSQKDVTQKIQSLPSITKWMATLRSRSGNLSSTDLEISFFQEPHSQKIRYENFKSLFKSLYGIEDFKRNDLVHKVLNDQIDFSGFVYRDEFILKALTFAGSLDTEIMQQVLREIMQNATVKTSLPWKEWLSYLECIVANKEFVVRKGNPQGILVTKIMSGHSDKSGYRIFLGLTDESLKNRQKTQLSGNDYFELAKDIGFYLDNPDQSDLEFELLLLADADSIHDVFCFGATDLTGTLCSPSTFWLSLKDPAHHEVLSLPKETRWDDVQNGQSPRLWLDGRRQDLHHKIQIELGHQPQEPVKVLQRPTISASSIETFLNCPFVFAAQKYFKLQDLPDVDLDVDHRTRGQLAHALFERLTIESFEQPMRFVWTVSELDQLLETLRIEKKLIFADDRLWVPLKRKHVQLALRFLEFEKNWRKEFPKVKTLGREQRFDFYLNPTTQEVGPQASPDTFRFTGQIDRIDADDQGHLIVIDYKSSGGGLSAHGSWFQNNELQLLFYMWVLEKSLIPTLTGDVAGLLYFIFKSFEHKGFFIGDLAGQVYPAFKRPDKNATYEAKEKYLTKFSELLMETLDRIKEGEVAPKPADEKNCVTCEWRGQCRAPHLN